jgi:2,3-bisphosphoglycerate-independent phosphoglycerate mutase
MSKKLALIILDGWGIGDGSKADAIANSKTPFYDHLLKSYPHSQLLTNAEHVGLPAGQMGNSEVGHLNIGAGRVVYQDLELINKAIREKTFDSNPELLKAFEYAKKNNKPLHLMGLLSPGGIHSHEQHLYKLCDLAKAFGLKNIFIHAFMDGRDCDPKSGMKHIINLDNHLRNSGGKIATLVGRYYAMDRDKRWERVKLAYDLLVNGAGKIFTTAEEAVKSSYDENVTDEFIKPCVIGDGAKIKEGDAVRSPRYSLKKISRSSE